MVLSFLLVSILHHNNLIVRCASQGFRRRERITYRHFGSSNVENRGPCWRCEVWMDLGYDLGTPRPRLSSPPSGCNKDRASEVS